MSDTLYEDELGAGRTRVADCRGGVHAVWVGGRLFLPAPAALAAARSREACGLPVPDIAALVGVAAELHDAARDLLNSPAPGLFSRNFLRQRREHIGAHAALVKACLRFQQFDAANKGPAASYRYAKDKT